MAQLSWSASGECDAGIEYSVLENFYMDFIDLKTVDGFYDKIYNKN